MACATVVRMGKPAMTERGVRTKEIGLGRGKRKLRFWKGGRNA